MRHATRLLTCIALCGAVYLCTPAAWACVPPGPACHTWNSGTQQWEAYGCVETPCTDDCTTCDLQTCDCECEVTINTAEADVTVQAVGVDVTFTMTTSPADRYDCVSWSGGGDPADGSGSDFTTKWDTPGVKTVTVKTCGDDGDSEDIEVTIVGVEKVVEDGTSDEGSIYTCLGNTVYLEAIPDPNTATFPSGNPTWEITSRPTGDPEPGSLSSTDEDATLSDLDVAGDYVVEATYGTSSDSITVVAIEVESLEPDTGTVFDDGIPDANSFAICVADTGEVTVTATPNPAVDVNDLPSCWTLDGTSGELVDKLHWKTSLTSPGITTVTCESGTSSKVTKLYITEVSSITVNSTEVADSNMVVLQGSEYTFTAELDPEYPSWPEDMFEWSGIETGSEQTIAVTFDSAGTFTLKAEFNGCNSKQVNIRVVKPSVSQFGFGGDNTLYETPEDPNAVWEDSGIAYVDPTYIADPNGRNSPVCTSKDSSSVTLSGVILTIDYPLTFSEPNMLIDATGTEDWDESSVSFSGTTSASTSLGITDSIIDKVYRYAGDFNIQWKYKIPGGTDSWIDIDSTSHTMYVTWDTPAGDEPTEQRIDWVCEAAHDEDDLGTAADEVYLDLRPQNYTKGAPNYGPTPIWTIHNGEASTVSSNTVSRFLKNS